MRQVICLLGLHKNRLALATIVTAAALLHTPRSANGQLLKRIEKTVAEHATRKVVEHQARVEIAKLR